MKILIADRISPIGIELFKAESGFEVIEAYGSTPEQVLELVKDVDAIALRSDTRVTAEIIAAAPQRIHVAKTGNAAPYILRHRQSGQRYSSSVPR